MINKIPKIIHYCWFGNNEKPEDIKKYMSTWSKLGDYKIIEWNESNSDLDSNEYLRETYSNKKWAFVSDYIRLQKLYEYGGIYIDTDVEIEKNFDDLLDNKMFLGFIYDCSIGAGVIAAVPKHPLIKELLDLYEDITYVDKSFIGYKVKGFDNKKFINNNDLFTAYILKKYPQFKLNNQKQDLGDFVIYPKEEFVLQPIIGKGHCIHRGEGSWNNDCKNHKKLRVKLRNILSYVPVINVPSIITHIKYKRMIPNLPFYNIYIQQKNEI